MTLIETQLGEGSTSLWAEVFPESISMKECPEVRVMIHGDLPLEVTYTHDGLDWCLDPEQEQAYYDRMAARNTSLIHAKDLLIQLLDNIWWDVLDPEWVRTYGDPQ